MINGIKTEYILDPSYFEVGCAYKICLGTNDYKVGLLVKYSKYSVTFKILEKGNVVDLTLTVDQVRCDYEVVKMTADYKDGTFSSK